MPDEWIGREYALMLAQHGAKIVVNDLGGARDGTGDNDVSPAQSVVDEIVALGGEAIANGENVADFEGAKRMVHAAVEAFGDLHVVINNAGILRDRMLANMTEAEWDAVINVHLKGTFAPTHHAVAYWRDRSKAGHEVSGRVINTTSVSGIYGNIGQTNYGAAQGRHRLVHEHRRPRGGPLRRDRQRDRSRRAHPHDRRPRHGAGQRRGKEAMSPRWIAPIVTWLASEESAAVTGRVFEASGRVLAVAEGCGAWAERRADRRPDRHGRARREHAGRCTCQLRHGRTARRPPAITTGSELEGRSVRCR
ncbi:MAG: SDR family NAD(P)-dependent oxidoreductase [Ilumatobacteraceae bacterium]